MTPARMILSAAIALLVAAPALAAPGHVVEDFSCAAAYGVMDRHRTAMIGWRPQLAQVQFATIDWAARRAKLAATANKDILSVFEQDFSNMVTKDIRDGALTESAGVLALTLRCDKAFGFSPSFMDPQISASKPAAQ